MPTVAVVGGSLGGLTAALVLADIGCDVTVHERSPSTLEARGAGICVLNETVRWFAEKTGTSPDELCSSTGFIRFLDPRGGLVHERAHSYRFSSWNTIYRALLSEFPPERYLLDHEVTGFTDHGDGVELRLRSGERRRVDLLVSADGINSAARQTLLPDVAPRYSGYVAWRGTLPEAELTARTFEALSDAITYQVLPDSHVLVYPIPGPEGSLEPGKRLMNFVWYRNVAAGTDFEDLMTDREGRFRQVSLPPGASRPGFVDRLRADATERLAPVIAEVVTGVAEPFVQAVFDIEVPRMVLGRVCLIGDAAFAVRPHAAAGTAKAAADGWELARQLVAHDGAMEPALAEWERRQLGLGRELLERNREIGDASQRHGTFTPGDPALIFGLRGPGC
ncbi:FAD binding domain-containing protein [Pseudonocardia acidicola]|uniref:NAD-binding protein n=1 Tax=Pseudonocardia acidicola TaxID=2724939 RepID=A0ABX1S827_9PSEU|nr:FAD binding domain-containing protein [Pseudonocardia acidicola]NMH96409.1 NAD-binding protein [Pseudonocardia acidicola]